jgi:anaphase-promoting complex subunit 6
MRKRRASRSPSHSAHEDLQLGLHELTTSTPLDDSPPSAAAAAAGGRGGGGGAMREADMEKLRSVVRDCLGKHLYSSAIFFSDKLATMAGNTPQDLYMQAQALFLGKEYRRALHLLRRFRLVSADLRFRYIAAKCLAEVKEWEECLVMLGEGEVDEDGNVESLGDEQQAQELSESKDVEEREIHISSAMCLLRGKAYEALENR